MDAGTATFKTVKKGVKVKIELKNMPFGLHGVHIHQNAVCDAPDFKGAGGHFNPDGKKHGYMNPDGPPQRRPALQHERRRRPPWRGDLHADLDLAGSAAPNSLFLNGGTSIVVHEKADDEKTDPSGASGNRIACGVIKY